MTFLVDLDPLFTDFEVSLNLEAFESLAKHSLGHSLVAHETAVSCTSFRT